MKSIFFFISLSLSILYSINSLAQKNYEKDLEIASIYFQKKEYQNSLEFYLRSYSRKKNSTTSAQIARCYKETNNYFSALKWYRKSLAHEESFDISLEYAELLLINEEYSRTKNYLSTIQFPNSYQEKIKKLMLSSDSAKVWTRKRSKNLVENCHSLNTPYSEITPSFIPDGLLFSSNRETIKISKLNGYDGSNFYNLYKTSGSIKKWQKVKIGWKTPSLFMLNDSSSNFAHPNLSLNGDFFLFSSNIKSGMGGFDLYICIKKDSLWSKPINLGPQVNTPGDEIFPYLADDDKLYFSSNGHIGMGGFDIFVAELTSTGYGEVENLKPPVNSSQNDISFIYSKNKNLGFLSSNRKNGKGNYDLFYVNLND